jgi:3-dehydroquinate synthase II
MKIFFVMKKHFWVDLRQFDKKFLTASLEAGADAVLVPKGKSADVKKLGKITTISEDGDMVIGKDVEIVKITKKEDEAKVVALKGKIPAVIENLDWTIIPLETLSQNFKSYQSVSSPKEAKLALETMERGADGICLRHSLSMTSLKPEKLLKNFLRSIFNWRKQRLQKSNLFL